MVDLDPAIAVAHTHGRTASDSRPPLLLACHAWFHEQIGGAFKLATESAEYFAGKGHRVFYVCGTQERAPQNPTVDRGVELWRYPHPERPSPHPANLWGHVYGAYRLTQQILRKTCPACLNGHSPLQFLGAALAAGKKCTRQVYTVHSPYPDELASNRTADKRTFKHRAADWLAWRIERTACRRATVVHGESQFTVRRIGELYSRSVDSKTVISPGWVDVERFRPAEDVAATRTALGAIWQTEKPIFLSVRRLEARMGLDSLIEAARILVDRGFDFRLLIGGSGSMEPRLRQLVSELNLGETVFLLGRVPDEELPRCYAAADCFVLPTRALECFGLIILEAYACGTPVIGTPVGAISELVVRQGQDWLTAGVEASDLAERMSAFLVGGLRADRKILRSFAEQWRSDQALESLARILLPPHYLHSSCDSGAIDAR